MSTKSNRQIKVYQQYRPLSYGTRMVPVLRLSGVWLEQAGFGVDDTVNITVKEKELIIKVIG